MSKWYVAAAAVAGLAVAGSAHALQLKLTPEQQCAMSDRVVVAEVVDVETRWAAAASGGIERMAYVHVGQTLRGTATDGLWVRLPGGTIDGLTHWVEDVPQLEEGARYVLFLDDQGEHHDLIGGEAAAVRLSTPGSLSVGTPLARVLKTLEACDAQ